MKRTKTTEAKSCTHCGTMSCENNDPCKHCKAKIDKMDKNFKPKTDLEKRLKEKFK